MMDDMVAQQKTLRSDGILLSGLDSSILDSKFFLFNPYMIKIKAEKERESCTMSIRKIYTGGLIALSTLTPMKAQAQKQFLTETKIAKELISETGICGTLKQDASAYAGLNLGLASSKNYFMAFAGGSISPKKEASFLGLVMDNYKWTKIQHSE